MQEYKERARRRNLRPRTIALAVGLAALAATGIAYATIPGPGGVIHGCYDTKTGVLRVIDPSAGGLCSLKETDLQWNQTGPQGLAGPQGAPGPRGPSNGYATSSGFNPQSFSINNELTVTTLVLPAGNYVVDAKVLVGNRSSASDEEVTCSLRFGPFSSGLLDIAGARLFGGGPAAAGSFATLPLVGSISLSASETITVLCATTSADAFAQYAKLNAVQVETLTLQ